MNLPDAIPAKAGIPVSFDFIVSRVSVKIISVQSSENIRRNDEAIAPYMGYLASRGSRYVRNDDWFGERGIRHTLLIHSLQ